MNVVICVDRFACTVPMAQGLSMRCQSFASVTARSATRTDHPHARHLVIDSANTAAYVYHYSNDTAAFQRHFVGTCSVLS